MAYVLQNILGLRSKLETQLLLSPRDPLLCCCGGHHCLWTDAWICLYVTILCVLCMRALSLCVRRHS